jgi:hypothetical protein
MIYKATQYREEVDRLSSNQRSLLEQVEFYRTRDSLSAASVEALRLKSSELERYRSDLSAEVEALHIKVRRLQSVAQTATATAVEIREVVRDSLVYVAGEVDTLRCVEFADPYVTFSGCEYGGQFTGSVELRDTLVQAVHRVPKRWWFFRWGTKAIRQEVVSKNPHTTIVYSEYVELKK